MNKNIRHTIFEEVNAVRYIAGYVIKSLLAKVVRSSSGNKEEIKVFTGTD